ncbi:hypothetical protein LIER_14671 [Lithospermum erythrorhizon]|uniref:Uncharacterized protein n=1 Tax=Lithospermum erythrorhizon TaxID=34254 RepID=A0AAV3Q1L0_LITER
MEPDSEKVDDETCSKPRRKGSYARHGIKFKIRKSTGYRESSSDDATDNVLSKSDVTDGITSIASSSDEEEVDRQQKIKLRYVHFKDAHMRDPKFFPGLVFSSKNQVRDTLIWYYVWHHKPIWMGSNDNKRISVKCEFSYNFSIWFGRDKILDKSDWSLRSVHQAHTGCPDVRLHLFNITFLTSGMEGKFKVLFEITLATIQVFIDEMFHIKASPNCARRIK